MASLNTACSSGVKTAAPAPLSQVSSATGSSNLAFALAKLRTSAGVRKL